MDRDSVYLPISLEWHTDIILLTIPAISKLVWSGWVSWHLLLISVYTYICIYIYIKYTYIYLIYMIGFSWVLWHINHCRLFNAKFSLYINIEYIYNWV